MITVNPCNKPDCRHYRDYVTFGPIVTILDRRTRWEKIIGIIPKGYALPICRDCKYFERFDLYEKYQDMHVEVSNARY